MLEPNRLIATVYLAVSPAQADTWLAHGVPPTPTTAPAPRAGRVVAWLAPTPPPGGEETVWLVATVEAGRALVADWDLARGAEAAQSVEDARRLVDAYRRTATSLADYRLGQFRRPQAWVMGGLPATTLARLSLVETSDVHGLVYARQIHRALRAMVGAPADAPLAALVAAAVARERARLVATYPDPGPVYLYSVDGGVWYVSLESAFNTLTALP